MVQPILFDAILGLIVIEALALIMILKRRNRAGLILPAICFLVSGAALMMALRFAISDPINQIAIQMLLALSFIGHAGALWSVWKAFKSRS